jgi:hypothetical protein
MMIPTAGVTNPPTVADIAAHHATIASVDQVGTAVVEG